jgi:hypothetical protein
MGMRKRHHYVPRFYLEGFIDPRNEPFIWVYEKGNQEIRRQKAEKIACEKHYYSFITESGDKDSETIEKAFEDLETKTAPILKKIKDEKTLSNKERGIFSYFIAYIMTRVPNYRKNVESIAGKLIKKTMMTIVSDREEFRSKVEKLEKVRGEKFKTRIEDFTKAVMNGKYDIEVHPEFSLGMIGLARELAPLFYKMSWAFLKATNEYKFLTSDNPLYYFDPTYSQRKFDGVGLLNDNVEVYFPISRESMLLGSWKNLRGYFQLKDKHVRDINRRTVIFALRFIFASKKSSGISILVQKYKESHPKLIIA